MRAWVHPRPGTFRHGVSLRLALGIAADESFTYVDPSALVSNGVTDLFVYCGAAMPTADYCTAVRAAGISLTFIDEGAPAPYAVGDPYGAGVQRAQLAEAKLATLYPPSCRIVYVLSDQDSGTPGTADGRVAQHAVGISTGTTRPGWVGYGNRNAIDAARAATPKLLGSWVPRTWGADGSDALVQEIGSPVGGLDVDTIQQAEWGQWHAGAAPVTTPKGQRVEILVGPRNGYTGNDAVLVAGSRILRDFGADNPQAVFGMSVPKAALDWHAVAGRGDVPLVPVDAAEMNELWWPTHPAGAETATVDTAALAKALVPLLPAGIDAATLDAHLKTALGTLKLSTS